MGGGHAFGAEHRDPALAEEVAVGTHLDRGRRRGVGEDQVQREDRQPRERAF
jgi:hypothetical protein